MTTNVFKDTTILAEEGYKIISKLEDYGFYKRMNNLLGNENDYTKSKQIMNNYIQSYSQSYQNLLKKTFLV